MLFDGLWAAPTVEINRGLLHPGPLRQNLPVRVVLRLELAAAGVEQIAAGLGRERVVQEAAGGGVVEGDQARGGDEILARLLVVPGGGARRKLLQVQGIVAFRMTD